jgi:hypothetical protein
MLSTENPKDNQEGLIDRVGTVLKFMEYCFLCQVRPLRLVSPLILSISRFWQYNEVNNIQC